MLRKEIKEKIQSLENELNRIFGSPTKLVAAAASQKSGAK